MEYIPLPTVTEPEFEPESPSRNQSRNASTRTPSAAIFDKLIDAALDR